MDYRGVSVARLAADIRSGRRKAEAVLAATLERIQRDNRGLNAFVALASEEAVLARARLIDGQVARGEDPGPLAGIALAVKDLEDVAGLRTTFGSALWADAEPAARDSIQVARLQAAGAVVVGKTNTPEFGCKGATDNTLFGPTCNPWNPEYSPGGSSGGSSAALAAGLVPLATGSDGGGSIRIPAALCGHSGFKPSQGLVPMGGAPTTGILAVRAPMALTIEDTVLALDVVRGDSGQDIFGLADDASPWLGTIREQAVRLPERVIWCPTLGFAEIDAEVLAICEAAVEQLQAAGVDVIRKEQVFLEHPVAAWWTLWTSLMARKLEERRNGPGWEQVDPALQAMVDFGLGLRAVDLARAIDACHLLNDQLHAAFSQAPLILSPTCAGRAPRSGADGTINGRPTTAWVEMTFGFNLTRNPAASLFAGCDAAGLPVGLQLIGPQRQDRAVLAAAAAIERLLGGPGHAPFRQQAAGTRD